LADADGCDAAVSGKRPVALLPLGGHKGQCLGMMISILCSVLGEAPFDWEIPNLFEGPFDRGRQISHLIAALDVTGATEPDAFRTRLSSYLATFRSTPAQPGLVVSCPGDVESAEARRRTDHGVPLSDDNYAFLQTVSRG
jgi:LDH2 family malate/lactate/ureidoglycolate dehydrogenase